MPDYSYHDFMIFTGKTNQHLGRFYECPRCRKRYWSAWGWARRHYRKEIHNIVDIIIKLGEQRREGEPISNKEIYEVATGNQRYNRKAWEPLKQLLRTIANKTIKGYLFFTYNPMLASRYNFKLNPELEWGSGWCAGFQLFRREEDEFSGDEE